MMRKLKLLKDEVKSWSVDYLGAAHLEKRKILKRVEEIDRKEGSPEWVSELQEERRGLKRRHFSLMEREDRALKLKCKSIWVREGDANTKLFHRLLSARRTRNTISKLEIEEGAILEDEEEIIKKIVVLHEKFY